MTLYKTNVNSRKQAGLHQRKQAGRCPHIVTIAIYDFHNSYTLCLKKKKFKNAQSKHVSFIHLKSIFLTHFLLLFNFKVKSITRNNTLTLPPRILRAKNKIRIIQKILSEKERKV